MPPFLLSVCTYASSVDGPARKLVVNRPAKQKGHKLDPFEKRGHRSILADCTTKSTVFVDECDRISIVGIPIMFDQRDFLQFVQYLITQ